MRAFKSACFLNCPKLWALDNISLAFIICLPTGLSFSLRSTPPTSCQPSADCRCSSRLIFHKNRIKNSGCINLTISATIGQNIYSGICLPFHSLKRTHKVLAGCLCLCSFVKKIQRFACMYIYFHWHKIEITVFYANVTILLSHNVKNIQIQKFISLKSYRCLKISTDLKSLYFRLNFKKENLVNLER